MASNCPSSASTRGRTTRLSSWKPAAGASSLPPRSSSLLLLKAAAGCPTAAARRSTRTACPTGGCAAGSPRAPPSAQRRPPVVRGIEVEPARAQSWRPAARQQLRVTAIDAAGRRRCVTTEAEYQSNASTIAGVDRRGWFEAGDVPGRGRHPGPLPRPRHRLPRHLAPAGRALRPPRRGQLHRPPRLGQARHAWASPPSEPGRRRRRSCAASSSIPSAPCRPRRRPAPSWPTPTATSGPGSSMRCSQRPEYADYWAMRWSDLLRVDKDTPHARGRRRHDALAAAAVRRQPALRRVRPRHPDRAGPDRCEGPAAFYRSLMTRRKRRAGRSASSSWACASHCAQCHHHPSAPWGQDDYFGLAGFFTGVCRKPLPGGASAISRGGGTDLKHPRTGKPVPARALGAAPADFAGRPTAGTSWPTG